MGGGSRSAAASKTAADAGSSSNTATNRRPGTRVLGHRAFHLAGATVGTTPTSSFVRAAWYKPTSRGRGDGGALGSGASRRPSRSASTSDSDALPESANSTKGDVWHVSSRARRRSSASTLREFNWCARRAACRNHDSGRHTGSCGSSAPMPTRARSFVFVSAGSSGAFRESRFPRRADERFSSFSHNIRTGYRTRASPAAGPW